jgi:hypothetical protein
LGQWVEGLATPGEWTIRPAGGRSGAQRLKAPRIGGQIFSGLCSRTQNLLPG